MLNDKYGENITLALASRNSSAAQAQLHTFRGVQVLLVDEEAEISSFRCATGDACGGEGLEPDSWIPKRKGVGGRPSERAGKCLFSAAFLLPLNPVVTPALTTFADGCSQERRPRLLAQPRTASHNRLPEEGSHGFSEAS